MVIVKETYILAVQAKSLHRCLTISEHAWILEASSVPAGGSVSFMQRMYIEEKLIRQHLDEIYCSHLDFLKESTL
ncbi:MAG: hypothetical protein AAB403_15580 [Planctomycetota bacterium]